MEENSKYQISADKNLILSKLLNIFAMLQGYILFWSKHQVTTVNDFPSERETTQEIPCPFQRTVTF